MIQALIISVPPHSFQTNTRRVSISCLGRVWTLLDFLMQKTPLCWGRERVNKPIGIRGVKKDQKVYKPL